MKRLFCLMMACLMMTAAGAALAMTEEAAIARAKDAIWAQLGSSIPLGDEAAYAISAVYSEHREGYRVSFEPKVIDYGLCMVWVDENETKVERADEPGYTGDTLFTRFQAVYGYPSGWNQNVWLLLDRMLEPLEVTSFSAQLMKETTYAGASQAIVTREEAFDIALRDYGQPEARTFTGVLISTIEGPVWKLRVMGDPACRLYEIDGMTGAILDREDYKADNYDFDNPVKMYTLRRDYEPALVKQHGMEYIAAVAVSKAYGDMRLDDPMLGLHEEAGEYEVAVTDRRVEFRAQEEGRDSYFVTFDENSMIEEVGHM